MFWGTSLGIWQTEVKAESGIDGCLDFREYQPMGGIIETCQNRVDIWRLSPSAIIWNEQSHLKSIGSFVLGLRLRFHRSNFCGLCSFESLCANGDFIKIDKSAVILEMLFVS